MVVAFSCQLTKNSCQVFWQIVGRRAFFGSFKYDWKLNQIHNRKRSRPHTPFFRHIGPTKSTWQILHISLPKTNQQQPIFKLSIRPSFGTQTIRCTITNWPGQCSLLHHEKPARWNQARKRYFKIELLPKHDPHQETFKQHRTTIQRLCHYTILPRIDRKNTALFV